MITITSVTAHTFKVGDSVRFRKSNRHRHVVKEVLSGFHMLVEEFVRPSRGFAKHNRRMKAMRP